MSKKLLLLGDVEVAGRYTGFARKKATKWQLRAADAGRTFVRRYDVDNVEIHIKALPHLAYITIRAGEKYGFWLLVREWSPESYSAWYFDLPENITATSQITLGRSFYQSNVGSNYEIGPPSPFAYETFLYSFDQRAAIVSSYYSNTTAPFLPYPHTTEAERYTGRTLLDYTQPVNIQDATVGYLSAWFTYQPDLTRVFKADSYWSTSGASRPSNLAFTNWNSATPVGGRPAKLFFTPTSYFEGDTEVALVKALSLGNSFSETTQFAQFVSDGWFYVANYYQDDEDGSDVFQYSTLTKYNTTHIIEFLDGTRLATEITAANVATFVNDYDGANYKDFVCLISGHSRFSTQMCYMSRSNNYWTDSYVYIYVGEDVDSSVWFNLSDYGSAPDVIPTTMVYYRTDEIYVCFTIYNANSYCESVKLRKFYKVNGVWTSDTVYTRDRAVLGTPTYDQYTTLYGSIVDKYVFVTQRNSQWPDQADTLVKSWVYDIDTGVEREVQDLAPDIQLAALNRAEMQVLGFINGV